MNSQCANTCQAVVQTRRLAGLEAQSPAITYVADREMGYADIKDGQQMIQDDVRGWGQFEHRTIQNQFETKRNSGKATVSLHNVVEKKEKRGMRIPLLIAGAVASAVAMTAVFAQAVSNDGSAPTRKRYLPQYTESGDLILKSSTNATGSSTQETAP